MKRIILSACMVFAGFASFSQVSPSNLNNPANSQPVPNSTKTEKSALPPPPPVILPSTYIPPVYPGAETYPVETQRNLIFPAAPPAPTQPVQREPVTNVETTNNLNPTQPPRDASNRNNRPVGVTP